MAKILIVDDEPMILKCLKSALTVDGHDIVTVAAGDMALKLVGFTSFDVIITDYSMPRMDGIKFLQVAQERSPGIPVIMITGYGTPDTALEAMQRGAFDYLPKPFSLDSLRQTVGAAVEYVQARQRSAELAEPGAGTMAFPNFVAVNPAMVVACKRIAELARTNDPVLLQGESGTGKEQLARTLHALGIAKDRPFEVIDCPRVTQAESIGGLLSQNESGSIFFREIGALRLALQTDLLGVLRSGEFSRPGGAGTQKLSGRIVASTSIPVSQMEKDRAVNTELLDLLKTNVVLIPPLRERPEDIRLILALMLKQMGRRLDEGPPIQPEALLMLERYPWPGNLNELEAALRNAVTMSQGGMITTAHLPRDITAHVVPPAESYLKQVDMAKFRGRVVKSFLQNAQKEYRSLLTKMEGYTTP